MRGARAVARPRRPVFLDRARYRQSRVRDAARLLPILGAALLLLPLLWPDPGRPGAPTNSGALLYVFGTWGGLIAAAFGLSRLVRADDGGAAGEGSEGRR